MNTCSGVEPDYGSGGNPLTYVGAGTRCGTAHVQDAGASSYSPGGNAANYAIANSPLAKYPSGVTSVTIEAWVTPSTADMDAIGQSPAPGWAQSGIVSTRPVGGGGWLLEVLGNQSFAGNGDGTNNEATSPLGSIVAGGTYLLDETYDKVNGITIYDDCVKVGSQSATYYSGWPGTGPIVVGQLASNTGNGAAAFPFNGTISNVAIYPTELSPARMCAHYAAAGAPPTPAPTPVPTASPTPAPSATPIAYDATNACIAGNLFTNNVLPNQANGTSEGDFTTAWDRTWWERYRGDGTQTAQLGNWVTGDQFTWGRFQFGSYMGDHTDGTGYDPFTWGPDTGAPGSPNAISIESLYPNPLRGSFAGGGVALAEWTPTSGVTGQSTTSTAAFTLPQAGGSVTFPVTAPDGAQNTWLVGQGKAGSALLWYGTLTAGGQNGGTSGTATSPWTLSNIVIVNGAPGTVIPANSQFEVFDWPEFYSGVLFTPVNLQYGFIVGRVRTSPMGTPGVDQAFWFLTDNQTAKSPAGNNINQEWDAQESFGSSYPPMNAGTIWWNSALNGTQNWGGTYVPPFDPSADYHDYGYFLQPGGVSAGPYGTASPGPGYTSGTPNTGTTFYLDGQPQCKVLCGGHDLTTSSTVAGSYWKELYATFQSEGAGSWLGDASTAKYPLSYHIEWIRVYQPTGQGCTTDSLRRIHVTKAVTHATPRGTPVPQSTPKYPTPKPTQGSSF